MSGLRFGRLVALDYVGRSKWRCVCDCGSESHIFAAHLLRGQKSCGCLPRKKPSPTASAAKRAPAKPAGIKKAVASYPTHPIVAALRQARLDQDLSLDALADRAGYVACSISHVETGKRSPRVDTVVNLAEALGFDLRIELVPKATTVDPAAGDERRDDAPES